MAEPSHLGSGYDGTSVPWYQRTTTHCRGSCSEVNCRCLGVGDGRWAMGGKEDDATGLGVWEVGRAHMRSVSQSVRQCLGIHFQLGVLCRRWEGARVSALQ